jgi:ATP-binding cassette subfamily C (CFTR/MRP) protein 4
MLIGLIRSPTTYFDTTPTGRLVNRFSNDLSIMHTMLLSVFIIPSIANIAFLGVWFFFCKQVIIQTKQLDLRTKSPVFSEFNAITNGVTQIRIYGQTERITKEVSNLINRSTQISRVPRKCFQSDRSN